MKGALKRSHESSEQSVHLLDRAYVSLWEKALFPAWENVLRKRPTLERMAYLGRTESNT